MSSSANKLKGRRAKFKLPQHTPRHRPRRSLLELPSNPGTSIVPLRSMLRDAMKHCPLPCLDRLSSYSQRLMQTENNFCRTLRRLQNRLTFEAGSFPSQAQNALKSARAHGRDLQRGALPPLRQLPPEWPIWGFDTQEVWSRKRFQTGVKLVASVSSSCPTKKLVKSGSWASGSSGIRLKANVPRSVGHSAGVCKVHER